MIPNKIMAFVIIFCLFALLILGVPIAFTLGIVGLISVLIFGITTTTQIAQSSFANLDSFVLLAIPFFILAGNVMVHANLARYLVDFMQALARPITGGLAVGTTLVAALFGAMTGSSAASSAALGKIILPELTKKNHPLSFAAGLIAAGGTLAIMIPPSLTFVIYGAIAQVSVTDLFLAGIVPGLFTAALLSILAWYMVRRNKWGFHGKFSIVEVWQTSIKAIPALLMPLIVLGGIYTGFFTPTEAAAVSALYGILIGGFVYRTLNFQNLLQIFTDSAKTTAVVLFIIAGAIFIGMISTLAGIPSTIVRLVEDFNLSRVLYLLIVNVIIIILGCFFDGVTILTVFTPMFLPSAKVLGIDLIHFAMMITLNIEIASVTPPVGVNLFVISGIAKKSIEYVARGVLPFIFVLLFALAVVTYVPSMSLVFK